MPAIFISYRRKDTLSATGRLEETLAAAFGAEEVFRDLQDVEAGSDFRISLADGLREARVVIVVIGPSWLGQPEANGASRLFQPQDYVRQEIETALSYDLPIIPVVVEGAHMPNPDDLPESIRELGYRQAQEVSESRWDFDTDRLIGIVARIADLAPRVRSPGVLTAPVSLVTVLRDAAISLPDDFINLLYAPRRFLAARATNSQRDLIRAFVFLMVLQPIGASLVLLEWPTQSGVPEFLLTSVVATLLVLLTLSVPLNVAWRLVGAPRQYRRVLIILLYQCSVAGLVLSLLQLISFAALNIVNPNAVSNLAKNTTAEGLIEFLGSLQAAGLAAPWVIAGVINDLTVLTFLIWLAVTWGAYRDALQQSRARSVAVLALFMTLCAIPVGLLAWVASYSGK